ncbi:hypothetical protein AT959_00035 [Dechloromonas denitrificans]|uniref:DUF3135 domain-containing protein n=1 Tax=Dechloromonas denitrificans TaxID=281362 RepID=A0A133XNX1_9RHOO|nr:DUF3135 domain-containing protein [Dechloromonas denitrificans]KXB32633.1 hypothetical protein AT959_00035 [Dechloromonas denitrificans]
MNENRPVAILPPHEALARLASEDPEALEALRRELIERQIASAPEAVQLRLRQLQFRIDGIRKTSSSPLAASQRIHALMWESFVQLKEELHRFGLLNRGSTSPPMTGRAPPKRSAAVISLTIRRSNASMGGRL